MLSLMVHPGASAVYSHMKAPKHKQKEPEKNYLKHRLHTMKGWAIGGAAGGTAGAGLGHAAERAYAHARGKPKIKLRIRLPKTLAKSMGEKSVPFFLVPAAMGSIVGSNIGQYYGSRKGHEEVTGRKAR
jgi:hypothetical protein